MARPLRVKQRPFAIQHDQAENPSRSRWNSLRSKNFVARWQTLCSLLEDYWFEKRNGLVTLHDIDSTSFAIDSHNQEWSEGYGPTRKRHFRKLIESLSLPLGSVFVDVGCGAGKIVLIATQYPFKRIVGIEFSPWLCQLARANLTVFEQRYVIVPEIEIVSADITEYAIQPDENVFFMCNPFRGTVMQRFIENLATSLHDHPRPVWLLYNNPVEHDLIMEQNLFTHHNRFQYGGGTIIVYQWE